MSALKKLVSVLLVLTLAVSGGLLAWHGLHRTSAAPPAGQTQTPTVPAPPASVPDTVSTLCVARRPCHAHSHHQFLPHGRRL